MNIDSDQSLLLGLYSRIDIFDFCTLCRKPIKQSEGAGVPKMLSFWILP